jgi:succinoglycan biosynthesis protein ExoM
VKTMAVYKSTAYSTVPKQLRVCVAIPTFRRPEMLERLLDGIAKIIVPASAALEVLVIDNDILPSAHDRVACRRQCFPFKLSYAHVTEAGLCSVRNFALDRTRWEFDFVAMIDDDEVPQEQWLCELLRVQDWTQADVVIGPVPRLIPRDAPRWLRAGHFFDLPAYRDGEDMKDGYSGNCLLRVSSVERLGVRFDPSFNFAGGEDLFFFREMLRRGAKLAYAARAIAEESMSAERLTALYILQLNFRRGNTLSLCDRRLYGSVWTSAIRALKACGCITRGCATLIPYALGRGRAGALTALCDVARGFGALVGLFGHTYCMYERHDRAGC